MGLLSDLGFDLDRVPFREGRDRVDSETLSSDIEVRGFPNDHCPDHVLPWDRFGSSSLWEDGSPSSSASIFLTILYHVSGSLWLFSSSCCAMTVLLSGLNS